MTNLRVLSVFLVGAATAKSGCSKAAIDDPNMEQPDASTQADPDPDASEPEGCVQLGPNTTPVAIPMLDTWKQQMLHYGATHCSPPDLASTYYDGERVFLQIAEYTGDAMWKDCARAMEAVYRDGYVMPNNGGVPGYWNFTKGLARDFKETGDMMSRAAVIALSKRGAFAADTTPIEWTVAHDASREVAYTISAYIDAEALGEPRRARFAVLVDQALGHWDQWFVSKTASYVRPFMVGLTAEALIRVYELTGDPRIPPALKLGMDWLWDNTWLPSSGAFKYTDRNTDSGGQGPAVDLNLLIAPAFAWLYKTTGDTTYRDRGDDIFAGAVEKGPNYLYLAKQFNQNYRWSFDYVAWRSTPPCP